MPQRGRTGQIYILQDAPSLLKSSASLLLEGCNHDVRPVNQQYLKKNHHLHLQMIKDFVFLEDLWQ